MKGGPNFMGVAKNPNDAMIILPKKVNSEYTSETLLKQISLQVFLNYCTIILVVGFEYFLSDF